MNTHDQPVDLHQSSTSVGRAASSQSAGTDQIYEQPLKNPNIVSGKDFMKWCINTRQAFHTDPVCLNYHSPGNLSWNVITIKNDSMLRGADDKTCQIYKYLLI